MTQNKIKNRPAALSLVILLSLIIAGLYLTFSAFKTAHEKSISLSSGDFEHITFSRRHPNSYHYENNELTIAVDNSASFLMQAFTSVKNVDRVSFEWSSEGEPAILDAEQEKQRNGDDAVFKLGLLLESEESLTDVFLPAWMRRVEELLNFNTSEMLFLVADAKHAAGQEWPGAYNRRMTMIAVASVPAEQGWNRASYQFAEPVRVVAIWLMADGDDTHSAFTSKVRNIVIEEYSEIAQ